MAVRVQLRLGGAPDQEVVSTAVLNGGFEVPEPHLLLPAACAERLLPGYRATALRQEMLAAGGKTELLAGRDTVTGRVTTPERDGRPVVFRVLVSDADAEILVSDGGIDALGICILSFVPGRWRFADETLVRETAAPQYW